MTSIRGEPISLIQIYLVQDMAYQVLCKFGELNMVELKDINKFNSRKKFSDEIGRCCIMESALNGLRKEVLSEKLNLRVCNDIPTTPLYKELSDLEVTVQNLKATQEDARHSLESLVDLCLDRHRLQNVLQLVTFATNEAQDSSSSNLDSFNVYAGTMLTRKVTTCERILWRIGGGSVIFRHTTIPRLNEIMDEYDAVQQSAFYLLFQESDELQNISFQICKSFDANFLNVPQSHTKRLILSSTIASEMNNLKIAVRDTYNQYYRVMEKLADDLCFWMIKVQKMKSVFTQLNKLKDIGKNSYLLECWVSDDYVADLKAVLRLAAEEGDYPQPGVNKITSDDITPTLLKTNQFTEAFQEIVNAYGIPGYKELNPAPLTIITFPFLFAVMFGDFGHAVVITALILLVIVFESKVKSECEKQEILKLVYNGRYIILLLGMFSMYTGLIYNNIFSIPGNLFGSRWRINFSASEISSNRIIQLDPVKNFDGTPYPFGMDPAWVIGQEMNVSAVNSFKIKTSIIVGVCHMLLGMFVGLINYIYIRNFICIAFDFIPKLVFYSCLFVYLVALIFFKWKTYGGDKRKPYSADCAPFILIVFMNMLLLKQGKKIRKGCNDTMYNGQIYIERLLLTVALLSTLVMLFGKPMYIFCRRKMKKNQALAADAIERGNTEVRKMLYEDSISSILINQAVFTFETIFETISHTTSYLRLWALAFVHEQLTSIMWKMILVKSLKFNGIYGGCIIALSFCVWAIFTVVFLIVLEGLSVFLHTLRLHWFEFQSKFYLGVGKKFQPFSFQYICVKQGLLKE